MTHNWVKHLWKSRWMLSSHTLLKTVSVKRSNIEKIENILHIKYLYFCLGTERETINFMRFIQGWNVEHHSC